MPLVERAPAKVNLGLHVLRKRPNGDHDVETVLHRIDWADTITAAPASTLSRLWDLDPSSEQLRTIGEKSGPTSRSS